MFWVTDYARGGNNKFTAVTTHYTQLECGPMPRWTWWLPCWM